MSAVLKQLAASPMHALELGKAAEHLVCADLMLQGYRAYLSDQGLPYDVVVDLSGQLVRVQVKAACFATHRLQRTIPAYKFTPRQRGKNGQKRLSAADCDVIALVALDIRLVAYLLIHETPSCIEVYPPGTPKLGTRSRSRGNFDELPFGRLNPAVENSRGLFAPRAA